jgi:hypothetical protein
MIAKRSCKCCSGWDIWSPVFSVDKALNVAVALNFDLIITYVVKKANDRRSLSAELRRTNPDALLVFVAEDENDYIDARLGKYPGLSAVMRRPVSLETLLRIVEFRGEGFISTPAHLSHHIERRKKHS